jgi:hypothetical protein
MMLMMVIVVLAAVAAGVYAWQKDPAHVDSAASFTRAEGRRILMIMPPALIAAECFAKLLPETLILSVLGPQTGLFGILAASVVGGLLPGGPTISFPLAYLAARQGAGDAQLVALLTAWSAYAFHRILVFEAPMMGWRFVWLRLAAVAFMPPAVGLTMGLLTWLLGITFAYKL